MRVIPCVLFLGLMALAPVVSAHGALELNEFDTYALSDFEGQEDSFPWEGFEIWDIYAGDGYMASHESHGVYFKGNFAGDGTSRPTGSEIWELRFTFEVAGTKYERSVLHDGAAVTSDFEVFEWQLADGNVFQIHGWTPVAAWEGEEISNLVVVSSVDGNPRDIAPGGIFDPVTGQEIPVEIPATPIFPQIGEGRIVETVPLTGAAKFLDIAVEQSGNEFAFTVNNSLAQQGQHFMFSVPNELGWTISGAPNAVSLDGGTSTTFMLNFVAPKGNVEPLRLDFLTDIGGLQSWYVYSDTTGIHVVNDAALASSADAESKSTPAVPFLGLIGALGIAALARRR